MSRINIAIASPSDVSQERAAVPALFNCWNEANPQTFLHPVMWESASVPALGDHPQHLLNKSIVERSDLLIAIFWSKLGTPTPTDQSGTVEEIREFIEKKGPRRVMLYFCTRDLPYVDTDPADLAKLRQFKEDMKSKGLYHEYCTVQEFERDLFQHLGQKISDLQSGRLPLPKEVAKESQDDEGESHEHLDARLRRPIDYGTSLAEISSGFSAQMDDFDAIDGGGPNKFRDLAAHVYNSVAHCLDRFLTFSSAGMSEQDKLVLERISTRLKNLGARSKEYLRKPFPQYWADGREICEALSAHSRFLSGEGKP